MKIYHISDALYISKTKKKKNTFFAILEKNSEELLVSPPIIMNMYSYMCKFVLCGSDPIFFPPLFHS